MSATVHPDPRADVVRVSTPQELLAFIPHALGFHPTDSAVLVSIRAQRGRLGLVARVDRVDVTGPHGSELADQLADHVNADGAAQVALVVYTDGADAATAEDEDVAHLLAVLASAPEMPPVLDAWVVGPDWYRCLTCEDQECCPRQGRPRSELDSTEVAAAFVMAGSAPAPDRSRLAPGRDEDKRRLASFARAVSAERRRVGAGERSDLDRVHRAHGVLIGRLRATPPELARLGVTVSEVLTRDALIAWLVRPGYERVDRQWVDEVFEYAYSTRARPPDHSDLERATRTMVSAVRLARGEIRADLLAVLAWLRWWGGDGAGASVAGSEAVRLLPGQRLAGLVLQALERGLPPSWVRACGQLPA